EGKGFEVQKKTKRYTINENVFGRTVSGSEIDENKEPSEEAWELTKATKQQPEYFEIEFNKGIPVALNKEKMHGADILKKLNKEAGAHGYGRGLYFEDETIGIKGIQAFEAPGLLLLIEAHRALERAVMTRRQQITKAPLEILQADLVYRGMLYEPVMRDIKAFVDSSQQFVSGTVRMKLHSKTAFPVGVYSPFVLVRKDIAEYAQRASWKGEEAEAFIKLFSLQQRIATIVANEEAQRKAKGEKK
ncbi:MAG: argininosuccinate synthase, partial [Candidatus Diapherotrites archaeon]|nr:argininosuccinate synthase [Candidatus Diapherotrites archaeon]